jgi:hypothetical protein
LSQRNFFFVKGKKVYVFVLVLVSSSSIVALDRTGIASAVMVFDVAFLPALDKALTLFIMAVFANFVAIYLVVRVG